MTFTESSVLISKNPRMYSLYFCCLGKVGLNAGVYRIPGGDSGYSGRQKIEFFYFNLMNKNMENVLTLNMRDKKSSAIVYYLISLYDSLLSLPETGGTV